MEYIIILLKNHLMEKDHLAITQMIEKYDLPFNNDELINIFEKIRMLINTKTKQFSCWYQHIILEQLLSFALDEYNDLFLAMMYAIKNNYDPWNLLFLVPYKKSRTPGFKSTIGYYPPYEDHVREDNSIYCKLQDYYPFDASNLAISEKHKEIIKNYVSSKNVKSATKSLGNKAS